MTPPRWFSFTDDRRAIVLRPAFWAVALRRHVGDTISGCLGATHDAVHAWSQLCFAARLSILGFPSPPLSFHRMRVLVPCLCFMLLLASVEASDMFRSAYFAVSWRRRATA